MFVYTELLYLFIPTTLSRLTIPNQPGVRGKAKVVGRGSFCNKTHIGQTGEWGKKSLEGGGGGSILITGGQTQFTCTTRGLKSEQLIHCFRYSSNTLHRSACVCFG